MSTTHPSLEQIEHVHELNGLFLSFLQSSARERNGDLGLPKRAVPALLATGNAELDAVAEFPHALFRLTLDERVPAAVRELTNRHDTARHSLHLTILLSARTISRRSIYHARLLLGLESREIQQLRALQLPDIHRLAHLPQLLLCAFPGREWLWLQLLTETRPEARRQLALIALQPWLEKEWPFRNGAPFSA